MTANNRMQLAWGCLLAILISGSACTRQSSVPPPSFNDSQSTDSTVDQVCQITAQSLGVNASRVTPSTSLDELGADELDFVELVMEIEEHFQITISDAAIEDITGGDIFQGDMKRVTMAELARLVEDQK